MKAEVSRLGIKSRGNLSAIETITTGKQSMQLLILPQGTMIVRCTYTHQKEETGDLTDCKCFAFSLSKYNTSLFIWQIYVLIRESLN